MTGLSFKPRQRADRGRASSSLAQSTARRLAARIEELAGALLGEPVSKRARSWRYGAHQSLLINVAGERRVETREALSWARQWLGEHT